MRHQRRKGEGLPGRLVLGQQDHRAGSVGQVLHAVHAERTPQITRAPQIDRRSQPTHIQYSASPRTKIEHEQHRERHRHHGDDHPERGRAPSGQRERAAHQVSARARVGFGGSSAALLALASRISRRMRPGRRAPGVPGTCSRSAPLRGVERAPLAGAHQVRLAAGGLRRPAGRAACRRPSARRRRSTPKRSPICSNRPGQGLRQSQPSSGVCGQKNTASMRPPCAAQHLRHVGVHGVQRRHVDHAAADARLVGRDHRVPAGMVAAAPSPRARRAAAPIPRAP